MICILASQSPRRRELLTRMGIRHTVEAPDVDETIPAGTPPEEAVTALAFRKAHAIALRPEQIIIAADTVVVLDGEILGKPNGARDAFGMLRKLQGNTHQVYTGLCVRGQAVVETACEITAVTMDHMDDETIWRYIDTGEPMDKAGAYGVQGIGGMFISRICGNYDSVMGLPTSRLRQMLTEAGYWAVLANTV